MKFSLLTIAALSTTISCFKVWADTAAFPRKRKVAKKGEGSANSSGTCDPNCGGDVTEGQKCFGGRGVQGLCIDGLYCYISGTTKVDDLSGGAFCCPEGKAPSNVNTCGDRPPPGPGPGPGPTPGPAPSPDPGPGPVGWQQESALGMTYHGPAYDVAAVCGRICSGTGLQQDACWPLDWQGATSLACTDFCAKALNGGSYTIKGYDGEPVEVTNLAVGHCIGDQGSCGDSCGKTYVVYNKDSGKGGADSYAIIMGVDGAALPSFEMSTDQYNIFRGTTQSGDRVKPTYYNLAEGPYQFP